MIMNGCDQVRQRLAAIATAVELACRHEPIEQRSSERSVGKVAAQWSDTPVSPPFGDSSRVAASGDTSKRKLETSKIGTSSSPI